MKDNSCEFRKIILFQAGEIVHVVTEEESGMSLAIKRHACNAVKLMEIIMVAHGRMYQLSISMLKRYSDMRTVDTVMF